MVYNTKDLEDDAEKISVYVFKFPDEEKELYRYCSYRGDYRYEGPLSAPELKHLALWPIMEYYYGAAYDFEKGEEGNKIKFINDIPPYIKEDRKKRSWFRKKDPFITDTVPLEELEWEKLNQKHIPWAKEREKNRMKKYAK
jgi:hypothetical protein